MAKIIYGVALMWYSRNYFAVTSLLPQNYVMSYLGFLIIILISCLPILLQSNKPIFPYKPSWVKDISDLFHFRPTLLESNNPQNFPKNKKKLKKAFESLKQLPQSHKNQQFDFFGETKIILGDRRLNTHSLLVVKDYNSLTLFADHSLPDYNSFLENIMKNRKYRLHGFWWLLYHKRQSDQRSHDVYQVIS